MQVTPYLHLLMGHISLPQCLPHCQPFFLLVCVQMARVIPKDVATCLDNSCEEQCLSQQNRDCPITSNCQPST